MPKGRHYAKPRRPYLTTAELLESTGITRKTLRVYEDSGIIEPAHIDSAEYFKYWTLEQANDVRLVQTMRRADVPVSDIAATVRRGYADTLEAARLHSIDTLRKERRMLKAISHRQQQIEAFAPARGASGFYLRYLPMRSFAIIPLARQDGGFARQNEFVTHYEALKAVVEAVGWARAFNYGSLHAIDADGGQRMRFVFMELASSALPQSSARRGMDGGCYRVLDETGTCTPCDTSACTECSRFGRHPTAGERQRWQALEREGGHDFTLMADTPQGQRAMRVWQQCVLGGSDVSNPEEHGLLASTISTEVIARPQLMPSFTRLPCSVTACTLPDGIYLCHQFADSKRDAELALLRTTLRAMRHEPYDGPDTRPIPTPAEEEREADVGPFSEPFVSPRQVHDPARQNWFKYVGDEELAQLVLPTNMSLYPADGHVVVCSHAPSDETGALRLETQVLVNAEALL